MVFLELIPISTLLTLLTTQIIETAIAAHDVLVEKETFRLLSSFFMGIQPILTEMMKRNMADTPAIREALDSLQNDVKKARVLVETCQKKSKIYMLLHCRSIATQAQQISRDVARSLTLVSLASTEVTVDIRTSVHNLSQQMLNVEFQASEQKVRIIEKIESGLKQQETDQQAMNDIIREIARAVGLQNGDDDLKKVLESLRMDIDEASLSKEREEVFYMQQILTLLSPAALPASTPASSPEENGGLNMEAGFEEDEPPLRSFICPLSKTVMKDPVSTTMGSTYERSYIQTWFDSGKKVDPFTNSLLADLTLKPNLRLKKTIEEWLEWNNHARVRKAGKNLASDDVTIIKEALEVLCSCCVEIPEARRWIEEDKLMAQLIPLLKHQSKDVRRNTLSALQIIVTGDNTIKEQLLDAGGMQQIIKCLGRESLSKLALVLLLELLQAGTLEKPLRNNSVCCKLVQTTGSILMLATSIHGKDVEAAQLAKGILDQLCDEDQNIVEMAKANWFTPLINCLIHGSDESKLLMANTLAHMELTELNKQNLGEGGAIEPLVHMITGNLESKAASLKALESLSVHEHSKKYIAEAGAVPIVLQILCSGRNPVSVRVSAAIILERLVTADGRKYLIDENKDAVDLGKTIHSLLMVQENSLNRPSIRKHVLLFLLSLVAPPNAHEVRQLLTDTCGVSMLLQLLQCSELEIRDVAVQLLSCMADICAQEIAAFLIQRKLGGLFASLLLSGARTEVQAAAAGILARLPPENNNLTSHLTQEGVLSALVNVLRDGHNAQVKEQAVGSLLRFTLPSNISLQQKVVEMGIFPSLKQLMNSGSQKSKQRAVTVLANLSKSTLCLSKPPKRGWHCMLSRPSSVCKVHPGSCMESTTFCLVESISDIIVLLNEQESDTAGASIDALFTLIEEAAILEKGTTLLHEEGAIKPIIRLLSLGTDSSKQKALVILERIFEVKKMKDLYGLSAKIPLVDLAVNGNKQAARVLAELEAGSKAVSHF